MACLRLSERGRQRLAGSSAAGTTILLLPLAAEEAVGRLARSLIPSHSHHHHLSPGDDATKQRQRPPPSFPLFFRHLFLSPSIASAALSGLGRALYHHLPTAAFDRFGSSHDTHPAATRQKAKLPIFEPCLL
ncbi:hypothetical protein NU195Hw_g7125t1 [Hortaea werneckii]